jgi:hypothetical protein
LAEQASLPESDTGPFHSALEAQIEIKATKRPVDGAKLY